MTCKTPDAIFHIEITPEKVGVVVDLPMSHPLARGEAVALEDRLHDLMEAELAFMFVGDTK